MERIRTDTVLDRPQSRTLLSSSKVNKIAGPPGTGKTTTLLEIVEKLLSHGIRPEQIVYTTFTRAGAYEARDRAIEKFGYTEDEFPYFRTLHSLCYRLLGGGPIMLQRDWFALGHQIGLSFSFGRFTDSEMSFATKGDHMLNMWGLSRAQMSNMQDVHSQYPDKHVCSYPELEHFANEITQFKKSLGKMDYTDILERFVNLKPEMEEVTNLIVDEAQDLSNLQVAVVNHIAGFVKGGIWIGGDDDQCVHEWNGANADWFIDLEAATTVLERSYRIPASVHRIAEEVSGRISHRIPKTYAPREEEGEVARINLTELDMSEGRWMVLCRNKAFFEMFEEVCLRNGWPYHGCARHNDEDFINAARIHARLVEGQLITVPEAQLFYDYVSRTHIRHGGKKALADATVSGLVDAKTLVKKYGLKDLRPVLDMLDRATERQLSYLKTLIDSGELIQTPRIEISTIHNSKGRECDNVVICPDVSGKTFNAFQTNPDSEHRVFYVGVTRAKNRLLLLNPITSKYYNI